MNALGTHLRDPKNLGLTLWRMAVLNKIMDAAVEFGRNPVSKHQIHPEYVDEQAGAGRDGQICLAKPNSEARTGTGNNSSSLVSWPRAGLATLPGAICVMIIPYKSEDSKNSMSSTVIKAFSGRGSAIVTWSVSCKRGLSRNRLLCEGYEIEPLSHSLSQI